MIGWLRMLAGGMPADGRPRSTYDVPVYLDNESCTNAIERTFTPSLGWVVSNRRMLFQLYTFI